VVDVLGLCAAVLATMTVTNEHRPAGDSDACLMRHADIVDEPDDGGLGESGPGGVQIVTGAVKQLCLVRQHEDEGPSRGDDREGFERGIQHERPADHLSLLVVPEQTSAGGYRNRVRRRDNRHHSSHANTSSELGRAEELP
jgi:hypothetical protein